MQDSLLATLRRLDATYGVDPELAAAQAELREIFDAEEARLEDISLEDLDRSEEMLKASLFEVGRLAGLSEDQSEIDWQRIKLDAQFSDIHLEEL